MRGWFACFLRTTTNVCVSTCCHYGGGPNHVCVWGDAVDWVQVLAPVDADPDRPVQYDQVYEQLSDLRGKLDSTRTHRDNLADLQREQLATLEAQLAHCTQVLYKTDAPDFGTLPLLAPSIVESNLRLLHGNLDALTRAIKLLDTQIKAHVSALSTDPAKRREAALMETFYMKPQAL